MKDYLGSPPLLVKLKLDGILQLYLVVLDYVISSIEVKSEGKEHKPIFYVSKVLLDAETLYSNLEKLNYALLVSARKLIPYFKSHTIEVVTTFPIWNVLYKPDLVEHGLVGHGVRSFRHQIHPTDNDQVSGNFVFFAEFAISTKEVIKELDTLFEWDFFVDGSSNARVSGTGILLKSPNSDLLEHSLHFGFQASNNEDEYDALIAGLDWQKGSEKQQ